MILGGSGSYDSWGKWFPLFLGEVNTPSGQSPKPVSNQMAVVARYKKSSDGGHPEGHWKEWSNREFENIFRNGMAWGAKLEHVEVATVQLVLFNSTVILAPLEAFNLKN